MTVKANRDDQESANVPGTALLTKALDVIDVIAIAGRRPKIADIVKGTEYARPTLYRILAALQARGMIMQDPRDHAYSLGPRFTELAGAVARHTDLIALANRPLRNLAEIFGESVNLGVMTGTALQTIGCWKGVEENKISGEVGAIKPVHCTALGKALLSGLSSSDRAAVLSNLVLEQFTPNTHTELTALNTDIDLSAMRGFAFDDEEIIADVSCVAVPVIGSDGQTVAAISISGPTHRMPHSRRAEIAAELARVATSISTSLSPPDVLRAEKAVEPLRGFSINGIFADVDPKAGYVAIDGPGGRVIRVSDNRANTVLKLRHSIKAAAVSGQTLFLLSDGAILRSTISGGDPMPVATDLTDGADALLALPDGSIVVGTGTQVLRLSDGVFTTLTEDRTPDTPLCLQGGKAAWVAGTSLITGTGTFDLQGPVTAIVNLGPQTFVVARPGAWRLDLVTAGQCSPILLPVPHPTALAVIGDVLLVGSDRLGLSAAEIALAPLSGRVLRVALPRPENDSLQG